MAIAGIKFQESYLARKGRANMETKESGLSVIETAKLENAECSIADNIESVRKAGDIVGRALAMIRDEKLYREEFFTFEEYCQARWGFTRQRASQLIGFVAIKDDCKPLVDTTEMNERNTRPLKALPEPEQQAEAWQEAVDASNGTPAAKDVEAAVDKRKPTGAKPGPSADEVSDMEDALDKLHVCIDDIWQNGTLNKSGLMDVMRQGVVYARAKK